MAIKNPRIFIGLCEIAGFNGSLKMGFDEIGVAAQFFNLSDHVFSYEGNAVNNIFTRLIKFFGFKITESCRKLFVIKLFWILCYYTCTASLFLWAIPKFDTFIFSFGQSFLRYYDLPVLKFFKKQVIFVYLGSDSRPPYLNRKSHDDTPAIVIKQSQAIKNNIKKVERYADYIINHPPTSHFHERKIVQFMKIGIPTWFRVKVPQDNDVAKEDVIRILHAPSHSEGKGTDRIREAINNLKNKGYRINFIEIINRPNAEVLRELSQCDFVVDELYSDAIMARFAAEAAFFSKPAIVGGYAKEYDFGTLTADEIPPVHQCLPEDIEAAIEKLILDEPYRITLGKSAKAFLDGYWSPSTVAARLLRLIRNDVPDDWFYDPTDIRYLHGWGMPSDLARDNIKKILTTGGLPALFLADKPALELLFVEFAQSDSQKC